MHRILALIVARDNSKRLPGKNVRMLGGRPLIVHTFEAAKAAHSLDRIVLSTDSQHMADLARCHGVDVPFLRPAELAGDHSRVIDTALHSLRWLAEHEEYVADYVMLLQPTSPFRTAQDIDAAVRLAEINNAEAVVGVTEVEAHPGLTRRIDAAGRLTRLPGAENWSQDLPALHAINGAMYLVRTDFLFKDQCWCPDRALAYVMPHERAMDIDTERDFKLAELILQDRLDHGYEVAA
jgi:CMP-N,N'-diacetyllegionaminic acid synthase